MSDDLARALKVERHPERAVADRAIALAILDEGLICHVGFVAGGRPWVIPTMYAREGELLYLHGSPASRMLRGLAGGIDPTNAFNGTQTSYKGFAIIQEGEIHFIGPSFMQELTNKVNGLSTKSC